MGSDERKRATQALTAKRIAAAILRERHAQSWVMPSFTPGDWWECDVFCLSDSGYFTEFEIKISRADFKKDAAKAKEHWGCTAGEWKLTVSPTKHEKIVARDPMAPSRFFFVTPEGLLEPSDIPEWAGWIEAYTISDRADAHVYLREVKKAPRIHPGKFLLAGDPNYVRSTAYWRFHNLIKKSLNDAWPDYLKLEDGAGI